MVLLLVDAQVFALPMSFDRLTAKDVSEVLGEWQKHRRAEQTTTSCVEPIYKVRSLDAS